MADPTSGMVEFTPAEKMLPGGYDFIVVGSGSAGNVVASRLSEDKSVSVLLLESGGNNTGDPNVRIAWNLFALQETELDWQFRTTPQKNLKNSHGPGRVSKWPRGKAVGGSSTINAALYVRASPNDYNSWAKYHGCPLWSYEHCLPYFKKAQRFHGFAIPPSSPYVGTSGPLGVTEFSPSMVNPVSNDWMVSCGKALASIGCPLTEDYNGESPYGVGLTQATTEGGKRCDTFTGYLRRPDADTGLPITESRKDRLHVVTKAQVTRVALNDANTKAIGVYVKIGDGPEILVKAKKEVILSAGAIGSPWILQSSGIGDKAWLAEAGIECKVEIPAVGKNLKDHLFVPMVWENVEGDKDALTGEVTPKMMSALFNYNLFQSGPLATAMIESMAFANSGLPEDYPDLPRPDFEYEMSPMFTARGGPVFDKTGMDIIDRRQKPEGEPIYGFLVLISQLSPKSKGYVKVTSADPTAYPEIDANYLEHPDDLEVLVRGMKHLRTVAATEPIKSRIQTEVYHSAIQNIDPISQEDAYFAEYVRWAGITNYHPTSTCRMGKSDDPDAVLDQRCRVRGIEGLRVIDASSMPDITCGNTNAPTIMLAERASDLVKEDWKLKI